MPPKLSFEKLVLRPLSDLKNRRIGYERMESSSSQQGNPPVKVRVSPKKMKNKKKKAFWINLK